MPYLRDDLQFSAADMIAATVNYNRTKSVPSNKFPDKPASWVRSRAEIPYEFAHATDAVKAAVLGLASTILAQESGQPVDIEARSEDEIQQITDRAYAARQRAIENRTDAAAERRAAQANRSTSERNARMSGRVPVYGNTYAVRDQLRTECGATWDGVRRVWMVAPENLARANEIVSRNVGTTAQRPTYVPAFAPDDPRWKGRVGQLWEQCQFCGNEPTYMWDDGQTCCERCHR